MTGQAIAHAARHLVDTGRALWNSVEDSARAIAAGDLETAGRVGFEIFTLGIGVTKLGTLSKLDKLGDTARAADKVGDTSRAIRIPCTRLTTCISIEERTSPVGRGRPPGRCNMIGHSSMLDLIWSDAELDHVSIDYDAVVISLSETATGRKRLVRCTGYVGYQLLGFWDEVVVESARIIEEHEFLLKCAESLRRRYPAGAPDTGQQERNMRSWSVLVVTLSDGAEMLVAASQFDVE